jgi:WD40 repeat protein
VYTEGEPDSSASRFRVATSDLADLAWSPDSKLIAVWDSPLTHKVGIYKRDGSCVGNIEGYEGALGIRCVRWSPDSQLLAIGSFDQVQPSPPTLLDCTVPPSSATLLASRCS